MSIQNGTTLTKEGIEYLCGLIRDISGLDTKLIDDINLKTNGSWSSVHTKNMIDQSLTDSKAYVDKLIGALNKLSSKKTTVQPTLDNSEFNVIYLYSSSGSAPFDQYLKIGTNDSDAELVSLGSTNIDLTDYLTITDAVATYCKKTDFDALTTEVTNLKTKVGNEALTTTSQTLTGGVNELKTSLTSHINDTDIHVSTTDKEKWNEVVDKVFKYSGTIDASTTSGYVQINNPLGVECNIICSKMYISGSTPNGLSVTGQATSEKINVYVRNADGTMPPDGTNIKIAFILF